MLSLAADNISRSRPSVRSRGRVVIATPELDGYDGGAKLVAGALREAGYVVIYTGLRQTPEQIVASVIAEAASILGLSIVSGTHMTFVARVIELLAEKGASDTAVLVGGAIPPEDAFALAISGARRVFTAGTTLDEVVEAIDHLNAIYGSIVLGPDEEGPHPQPP